MKRSITSTLFLGILALILAWSPAYAAKQVATVVAARGDVQAVDAKGKSRPLPVKAPILEEDTIKTGPHSRVQIMFTDNTLINLGNETTMKIAEYRWQPEQNDGALKTQVKEGTFRVMGGALTKTAPQNFKTETPTATIGIRGSMYAGVVTPDFLSVVFQGGKGIEITNAFGTVEISKPGFGTKVAMSKPPLPPMKFTAQEMGEMNKALSGNGAGEKEEKKEDKKGKDEDKGKKEDKGAEKAPASKEEQSTAPAPADKQADSTAPAEQQATTAAPAPAEPTTFNSWETKTIEPVMATPPPMPPTPPLIPPVPIDLIKAVVVTKSQIELDKPVEETVATTVINSIILSGRNHFFLRDINLALQDPSQFNSTFLDYAAGPFTANLLDTGEIYGTLSNGKPFGPYLIDGYNPNASYLGFATMTKNITYNDDRLGPLNLTSTIYGDPSAQFFYSTSYTTIDATTDYLLGSLLYAGIPYAGIISGRIPIPATGIGKFTGHLIFNNHSTSDPDGDMEETAIAVNYYNRRLIGRSFEKKSGVTTYDKPGAVFFGTLDNTTGTAANLTVLAGGDTDPSGGGDPTTAYGTASATLYGSAYQGFGFTADGADYKITDGTSNSTWQATGAAMRTGTVGTSTSATAPYTGFVVGVGDNTAGGAVSRIFMNSAPADFTMNINPLTGVINGTINAAEVLYAGTALNLTIGGSADNSAYVANNDMVALFTASSSYTLRTYGNYLVTAGPSAQQITNAPNDFMTWGYWELAYTDSSDPAGSQSKDNLFSSQSFFVAGQQTPAVYLNSILGTASFTGTYDGKAFGVQLDSTGQNATQLTNGATHLEVNFPANTAANAITGTISFDQASLAINSVASASTLNNAGFNAIVSSVDTTGLRPRDFVDGVVPSSSAVHGAFYGTPASLGDLPLAVGGNFDAKMADSDGGARYLGVFGGSLTPPP